MIRNISHPGRGRNVLLRRFRRLDVLGSLSKHAAFCGAGSVECVAAFPPTGLVFNHIFLGSLFIDTLNPHLHLRLGSLGQQRHTAAAALPSFASTPSILLLLSTPFLCFSGS